MVVYKKKSYVVQDIKIRLTDLKVIRALLTLTSPSAEVNGHDRNNLAETAATTADAHIAAAENGIS
jgi:hypothetical protein